MFLGAIGILATASAGVITIYAGILDMEEGSYIKSGKRAIDLAMLELDKEINPVFATEEYAEKVRNLYAKKETKAYNEAKSEGQQL